MGTRPRSVVGAPSRAGREATSRNIAPVLSAAVDHYRAGRLPEAAALYRSVLGEAPDNVESMQGLAVIFHEQGRKEEALALFRRVIELDPSSRVADRELGRLLEQQGDLAGAAICYRRAIQLRPRDAASLGDLARALARQGKFQSAISHYRRAVALAPDEAPTHTALGNALLRHGDLSQSVASYRRALEIRKDLAEAHCNLGEALRRLGRLGEAVAACEQALALKPDLAEAHNNLGNALREQGKPVEATFHFEQALVRRPDWAELHNNLAIALQELGRITEAIGQYERALSLQPGLAEVHLNLANAYALCGRTSDAVAGLERALALKPDYPEALVQLAHLKSELCDWQDYEADSARVLKIMRRHPGVVPPFNLLTQPSTLAEQLFCARRWSERIARKRFPTFAHDRSVAAPKIRLGYLSADFRDHPVAYAITETIERHDRARFEVLGYSSGPDDDSQIHRRLEAAFDRFTYFSNVGNDEAARKIRADAINILIDLTGYTRHARAQILASRPAPIQVSFLGFLGTMGADFIDYIVADDFIAPAQHQPFYSERLVHLPGGWWPAEIHWEIAEEAPARAAYALPEDAFVFCCFNASYKIGPAIFDLWMRLLSELPNSVLWLGSTDGIARDNLRRAALNRGVGVGRLVFAPAEPMDHYLARHRLADLFLDTLPYNAVGTAYHALLAGLPVLTCAGETFAGRTAGSMLRAIGLSELITTSPEEYERLAVRLAKQPDLLSAIRQKLAQARSSAQLFDPGRAGRELEAAFKRMWEIWCAGESPRLF